MTAEDALARTKTAIAPPVENELVQAVLACWADAIAKAADAGERSVAEDKVARLRTPVTEGTMKAVVAALRADGFKVKREPHEASMRMMIEVSW